MTQGCRRGADRGERPQAAGAAVPQYHPAGAARRTGTAQRCRAGGVEAQDAVARPNHAPGHEPAGVHAAAGRAGAAAAAVSVTGCFPAVNLGSRMPGMGRLEPAGPSNSSPDSRRRRLDARKLSLADESSRPIAELHSLRFKA